MRNQKTKTRTRGSRALLKSLAEYEAVVRDGVTTRNLSSRFPSRIRVLVPDPGEYSPRKIRKLREKLNITQGDFAELLGISRILVQSWEQGVREPSALARRMLDTISSDPSGWLAGLRRQGARALDRRVG
jgi:DNA-binding transcriptional regulator YiaG